MPCGIGAHVSDLYETSIVSEMSQMFLCGFIHSKVAEVVAKLGLPRIAAWHVNPGSAAGHPW